MSAVVRYADVENAVKQWLLGTDVAFYVQRDDGGYSVFLAMPKGAPVPAVVITLVSGGPTPRADLPTLSARLQFDAWGRTRDQAGTVARTLVAELESLARTGFYTDGSNNILSAEVLSMRWLPDPDSDTPRYIVDALITTVT